MEIKKFTALQQSANTERDYQAHKSSYGSLNNRPTVTTVTCYYDIVNNIVQPKK